MPSFFFDRDSMAEWIRRLTTDQEIPGSSPGRVNKKFLEAQSFDLWTSRLQSECSTDWAIPPFSSYTFNKNVFTERALLRMRRAQLVRDKHSVPHVILWVAKCPPLLLPITDSESLAVTLMLPKESLNLAVWCKTLPNICRVACQQG